MAHGLDTILDAGALLQKQIGSESVRILLLGDGAERKALEKRAHAEGLGNVLFISSVPKEEVAHYWSLLDVAVIHLKRNDTFKAVIPSKVFECMAMGLPVLHGIEGESAEIIERIGCGLLFEPENAHALASQITALASDYPLRLKLRDRGLAAVGDYSRIELADGMLDFLKGIARV